MKVLDKVLSSLLIDSNAPHRSAVTGAPDGYNIDAIRMKTNAVGGYLRHNVSLDLMYSKGVKSPIAYARVLAQCAKSRLGWHMPLERATQSVRSHSVPSE